MILNNAKVIVCALLFCDSVNVFALEEVLSDSSGQEQRFSTGAYASGNGPSAPIRSIAPPPFWNPNFRLAGVTTINGTQTAHFSDLIGSSTISLNVGEVLPDGVTLLRIEQPDHPLYCKAIIGYHASTLEVITAEAESAASSGETTFLAPPPQEIAEAPPVSEERVAVRPFTSGKSW
jgi:hypothetical protein